MTTPFWQFFNCIPDILLFLSLNLNLFNVHPRGYRFFKILVRAGFPHSLGSKVDALPRRRGNQPRADLGVVLELMKVLNELKANCLEHVRGVRGNEIEFHRNGVDQATIANYQGLPRLGVPPEAEPNQLGITQGFVIGGAHLAKFPGLPEGMDTENQHRQG